MVRDDVTRNDVTRSKSDGALSSISSVVSFVTTVAIVTLHG